MENLALGYSSKMVLLGGSSLNSPRNVTSSPLFGLTTKPISITTRFSRPLSNSSVVCDYQSSASTNINKLQGGFFKSIIGCNSLFLCFYFLDNPLLNIEGVTLLILLGHFFFLARGSEWKPVKWLVFLLKTE